MNWIFGNAGWLIAIAFGILVVIYTAVPKFRTRITRIDRRVAAILFATFLALDATGYALANNYWHDVGTFWGAVFAGWVGSVLFFAFVGVAVAIVSLGHPEEESFDARARILFRGQTGKHIDYIILELRKKFEHYTEIVENILDVRSYHQNEDKFLLAWTAKTTIRNYINDVPTNYSSDVELSEVTPPPAGEHSNSLIYVRAGNQNIGREDFCTQIKKPFSASVEAGKSCVIESCMEYWTKAKDEPNTYNPARYTQMLHLYIANNIHGGKPLLVAVRMMGQANFVPITIQPGERALIGRIQDIEPRALGYDVRFMELT